MELEAHTLTFRSTHQTYTTAEYELHWTNSGGDMTTLIFSTHRTSNSNEHTKESTTKDNLGFGFENRSCHIFLAIGPMNFIFYSFKGLVSTSKPQNMSAELHLVFEISNNYHEFTMTFIGSPDLIAMWFCWCLQLPTFHMKLCNHAIHFKISLE